jgi:hypothetical protein
LDPISWAAVANFGSSSTCNQRSRIFVTFFPRNFFFTHSCHCSVTKGLFTQTRFARCSCHAMSRDRKIAVTISSNLVATRSGTEICRFVCCETAGFSWVFTKWIRWTSLSQWMYFECGAWLIFLTNGSTHGQRKWRLDLPWYALSRRINFKWGTHQLYSLGLKILWLD